MLRIFASFPLACVQIGTALLDQQNKNEHLWLVGCVQVLISSSLISGRLENCQLPRDVEHEQGPGYQPRLTAYGTPGGHRSPDRQSPCWPHMHSSTCVFLRKCVRYEADIIFAHQDELSTMAWKTQLQEEQDFRAARMVDLYDDGPYPDGPF